MARGGSDDVIRITSASSGRTESVQDRERRYLISMSIRVACFLAAIYPGPGWLRVTFLVAAVLLPYVAVVMANEGLQRSDGHDLQTHLGEHPELPAGSD